MRNSRADACAPGVGDPRLGVVYVNAAAEQHLGADQWVHVQVLRHLDRSRFVPAAALDPGHPGRPTPLAIALDDVPDVRRFGLRLGAGRPERSLRGLVEAATTVARALTDLGRLARSVRSQRIRVLHSPDRPRDAIACVALGKLTGATSVVHAHTGVDTWMGRGLRWALRRADARIAISDFVAGTLRTTGEVSGPIHVVHNGIDLERWTPGVGRDEARAELGLGPDDPMLLTVCRLFPSKGPGELIAALALVAEHHPQVQLVVVGEEMVDGFLDELRAQAVRLDVADRVHFLGRRSDVPRLMAAADVFAMPSVGEPFGLVFAEAMAMELPVVALDSGGAPEVIADGVTGLLSAPGDVTGLAEHLAILLNDPDLRSKMGRLGRQRVEQLFTARRMADGVGAVYERVARGERPSTRRDPG